MTVAVDISPIQRFLLCETPAEWVDAAVDDIPTLLTDHANCEKKAASTALNLLYRYVERPALLDKLSRLAREELRHFEQVVAIMRSRGIAYSQLTASRYAGELRRQVRADEPERLLDTLLCGAIIEARSCERFAKLVPHLDAELAHFYGSLLKSESRHFQDYLLLAQEMADETSISARLEALLETERALIQSPDQQFRFHSGVPLANSGH